MNTSIIHGSQPSIPYRAGKTVYDLTANGVVVPLEHINVRRGKIGGSWKSLSSRIAKEISAGLGEDFDGEIRLQRAVPGKRESANAAILYLLQGEGGTFDVVASLTHDSRGELQNFISTNGLDLPEPARDISPKHDKNPAPQAGGQDGFNMFMH